MGSLSPGVEEYASFFHPPRRERSYPMTFSSSVKGRQPITVFLANAKIHHQMNRGRIRGSSSTDTPYARSTLRRMPNSSSLPSGTNVPSSKRGM